MDTQFGPEGWGTEATDLELLEFRNCQYMTPETRNTTHFFWEYLRNFRKGDDDVGETLREAMFKGFIEDKVIIEAQQRLLETGPSFQPRGLASDNALAQFRRVWFEAIEQERISYPPAEAPVKNPVI